MLFSGVDVSSKEMSKLPNGKKPFLDTKFFDFDYGSNGERVIDVQLISSTMYRGTTMGGNATVFGVNFADGRIKGYPLLDPRPRSGKSIRCVLYVAIRNTVKTISKTIKLEPLVI